MKVAMITGATKNTGLAIARCLAREGWDVAITSRDTEAARTAATALAKEFSVTVRGYGMQLDNVESIKYVFYQVNRDFGKLNVFVANSANLGIGFDLLNTEEADYDAIVGANIKGTFFCCQEAAKLMMASGGGSIITMGSVQGTGAVPGRALYGMTKAALSHLARSMAYDLGQYGIRANNIVAGAIHSDRWNSLSAEEIALRRSRYPAGRESTEEEIAAAVAFLASEQAATITGTDLTVDSGISACLLPYQKKE